MQTLNNGETLGTIRGKVNLNFLEIDAAKVSATAVLAKTNTTPFSPTGDYHPAPKIYVDNAATAITTTYDPTGKGADAFDRSNHTGAVLPVWITLDQYNRFVTDAQITNWDNKEDGLGAKGTAFNKSFGTVAGSVAAGDHGHTKGDIGLGNVDNTTDAAKGVSTLQQAALDLKAAAATTYTKTEADNLLLLKRSLENLQFGDFAGGDFAEFDTDGTLTLNGAASTWEDINLDPTNLTGKGNLPVLTAIASTGLSGAGFIGSRTDEVEGCFEYPHRAKLNLVGETSVLMSFHCHILPTTTNGGDVRVGIEYVISDDTAAISTSTIMEVTATLGAVAWQKQNIIFGNLPAPSELGAQVHFKLYRAGGDALDTSADTVVVTTVGAHYEADALGSRSELVK